MEKWSLCGAAQRLARTSRAWIVARVNFDCCLNFRRMLLASADVPREKAHIDARLAPMCEARLKISISDINDCDRCTRIEIEMPQLSAPKFSFVACWPLASTTVCPNPLAGVVCT
jgi:hypothetical protein